MTRYQVPGIYLIYYTRYKIKYNIYLVYILYINIEYIYILCLVGEGDLQGVFTVQDDRAVPDCIRMSVANATLHE